MREVFQRSSVLTQIGIPAIAGRVLIAGLGIFAALQSVHGQEAEEERVADTQPATQTQPASQPAPEEVVPELPKAAEVIEWGIDAMGGRDAIEAVDSIAIKVKVISKVHDAEAVVEIAWAKPGKLMIKRTWSDGELTVGSDGVVGWVQEPESDACQLLAEDQTREVQNQAAMHRILVIFKKQFANAETVSSELFDDHEVFRVRGVDEEGQQQFAFFDVETKALVAMDRSLHTANGFERSKIRFSEWKQHGEISMFTKLNISQRDDDTVMTIEELRLNDVDAAVFELPEQVKALLNEGDAAATQPASQPATQPQTQPQTQPTTAPDVSDEEGENGDDTGEGGDSDADGG